MKSSNSMTSHLAPLYSKCDVPVELHIGNGVQKEVVKARVYRVSAGVAELSSPVYLPVDESVTIASDARLIQGSVVYCRVEASGTFDLGLRLDSDPYLRSEVRIPVALETTLQVLGSPGRIKTRVIDLSASGVGMEIPVPIRIGARVWIALGRSTALGEIRHCAPKGEEYRAGLRLEKLIRREDANARIWMDIEGDPVTVKGLAEFERSVEEQQSRSEALLLHVGQAPDQ